MKVFQILKVVEKQVTIVAMFLDYICNIFTLIISLSLSLMNGKKSMETLRLNMKGTSSFKLNDGVEGVDVANANTMEFIHINVHP
jgi:hypothetical protein